MTSIELLLDHESEVRVRAEWEALAADGMSSLAHHDAPSNRPHVTLLARSTPVPQPLGIDAAALPLPLVLGPPLLLGDGDRRVLARSVVPSAALLALHEHVLRAAGPGDDPRTCCPAGGCRTSRSRGASASRMCRPRSACWARRSRREAWPCGDGMRRPRRSRSSRDADPDAEGAAPGRGTEVRRRHLRREPGREHRASARCGRPASARSVTVVISALQAPGAARGSDIRDKLDLAVAMQTVAARQATTIREAERRRMLSERRTEHPEPIVAAQTATRAGIRGWLAEHVHISDRSPATP